MVSALDCCKLAYKQDGADSMRTRQSLLSRQGVFLVFVYSLTEAVRGWLSRTPRHPSSTQDIRGASSHPAAYNIRCSGSAAAQDPCILA